MLENPRKFEAGPDPFGRKWTANLAWLQTAISIRHSDSVDVKWDLQCDDGTQMERVVALMHPFLLDVAKKMGRQLTDAWCIRLAGVHLRNMIETWEDSEKTILTPSHSEIENYARKVDSMATAAR